MRVRMGSGSIESIGDECNRLGAKRILVITTPGQVAHAEAVAAHLGPLCAGIWDQARMHVPVATVDAAIEFIDGRGIDSCVVVGGGSAIGLGKALALRTPLTIVAVPTTYSGSEMTPVWGITADGRKTTGRDMRVLPSAVIYDPDLTVGLPVGLSAASALNAMAHAVEALYAPEASPIVSLCASEAISTFTTTLPPLMQAPDSSTLRSQALYAAWLCGSCLGATTMSLHHKLCHALGGTLDLPHAQTHAVMLAYSYAYNRPAVPDVDAVLQRALTTNDPARAMWELNQRLPIPHSLGELGVTRDQLDQIVGMVVDQPYANPRPLQAPAIRALLDRAVVGAPPSSARSWS